MGCTSWGVVHIPVFVAVRQTNLFSYRCAEGSWPYFYPGIVDSDRLTVAYTTSFYWVATTLSQTGYGDIRAHIVLEYVFTIVLMTVGFLVFNLCVISITAVLLNSSYSKLVHTELIVVYYLCILCMYLW